MEKLDNKWALPGGWTDIELSEGRNTKDQIGVCFEARKEKTFEAIFV